MNKKLNIAFFLDNFYPQINGVVTSSINTAFELSRRGHNIHGIVPHFNDSANYEKDYFPFKTQYHKGFKAYLYPDFSFTYPFSPKTFKAMKEFKPDIIHFHAPLTIGYQAISCAKKLNIPVVGTFHTFFAEPEYLSVVGLEKFKILQHIGWWYSNQYFNRCDAVVSPGIATADFLIKKNLKNKVHIISNGVEVSKYGNIKFDDSKFPFKIDNESEWILYIGRVSKEKCMDTLIDSFIILNKKRTKTKLLIVGDGPYLDELRQKVKLLNINEKIIFTGPVVNKNLLGSGVLNKMKFFVTASTSENQPMTILESIMFDLPIVGVDAKGIPELIEGNGLLVKPNDPENLCEAMLKILTDENLRMNFSGISKKLKDKYDIKNTTDKMEKLYYNLIDASK